MTSIDIALVQPGVLESVREYAEGYPVAVERRTDGRLIVIARNQGDHDSTAVDLEDLLNALARTQKREHPK